MHPHVHHRLAAAPAVFAVLAASAVASAQDWDALPFTRHADFQAVDNAGAPLYPTGDFPIKLRGVMLNDFEDMLDSTPRFNTNRFDQGGQVQAFVGAIDAGDSGGTAVYMGQNYGNLPFIGDTDASYTNAEWAAEVERVTRDATTGRRFQAGDLVEVRGRGGLVFRGKFNVNEQHKKSPELDWELRLIQAGFGLSEVPTLGLSDLLADPSDPDYNAAFPLFDADGSSGTERLQGGLVRVGGLEIVDPDNWGSNAVVTVTDGTLEFPLKLGLDEGFSTFDAPTGLIDVVGIMDQESDGGGPGSGKNGYRLWATTYNGSSVVGVVPEPASVGVLAAASAGLLLRRRRNGRPAAA